jgi:hypothetical protein
VSGISRQDHIALCSNIAFILYALGCGLQPIFILHSLLLPLNLYRIFEIKRNENSFIAPKSAELET